MRKMLLLLSIALSLAFGLPNVQAQDRTGPNGGLVAGKDGHDIELVATAGELTLYVLDEGKVQSTKGTTVKAVVQHAGRSMTIELKDVDNKKLVGKLDAPLGNGAIVVLTGKDGHGHAITARYVLK
jgi:maltose-binding protein MalE